MKKIPWQLGLSVAAGVPMLVLVSLGPVAGLVGPVSFVVWALSALIGLLMALVFAELVGLFPEQTGGIAVLSALALRRHGRGFGVLSQWSYWLGWSPALAINSLILGTYVGKLLLPAAPAVTAYALAAVVLCAVTAINHFGIRTSAWMQAVLALCALGPTILLSIEPWFRHRVDAANLMPFAPPGGWFSWAGVTAVAGALFVAGWSAYGSEIALTYNTEYERRSRDAVRTMLSTGVFSILIYTLVPLALIATIGAVRVQDDPSIALIPFARAVTDQAGPVVIALLLVALLLGLNMVMIGSSRTLWQMARNGYTWRFLGVRNRHGVPSNGLRFDLAFNLGLLAVMMLVNMGQVAAAPISLLAAANVGYFVSIVLALVAVWSMRRDEPERARLYRAPRGFVGLGLGLAALNVVLLVSAGVAWGWLNIGLGVVVLAVGIGLFWLTTRRTAEVQPEPVPVSAD